MTSIPDIVSGEELADLLGVDRRSITRLAERGTISRVGRGKFPIRLAIRAILAAAKADGRDAEAEERTRLNKARADAQELELAERRRDLIQMSSAVALLDFVVGRVRLALRQIPARASRDVAIRERIEVEVDVALQAISDALSEAADAARSGRDPFAPPPVNDNTDGGARR